MKTSLSRKRGKHSPAMAIIPLLLVFLMPHIAAAQSIPGIRADGTLDRKFIEENYYNGDFDPCLEALEHYRKSNPGMTRDDTIFVYKHLSVMYAAQAETRHKAESYMYQLLKVLPSAELLDMYISSEIQALFERVRRDYEKRKELLARKASHDSERRDSESGVTGAGVAGGDPGSQGNQAKQTGSQGSASERELEPSRGGGQAVYWLAGGTATAIAVGGFLWWSLQSDEPSPGSGGKTTTVQYEVPVPTLDGAAP